MVLGAAQLPGGHAAAAAHFDEAQDSRLLVLVEDFLAARLGGRIGVRAVGRRFSPQPRGRSRKPRRSRMPRRWTMLADAVGRRWSRAERWCLRSWVFLSCKRGPRNGFGGRVRRVLKIIGVTRNYCFGRFSGCDNHFGGKSRRSGPLRAPSETVQSPLRDHSGVFRNVQDRSGMLRIAQECVFISIGRGGARLEG